MESSEARPIEGNAWEGEIDTGKTRRRVEDVLRKSNSETVLKVADFLGVEVARFPRELIIEDPNGAFISIKVSLRKGKAVIRYDESIMTGFLDISFDKIATERLVANLRKIGKFVHINKKYKEGHHSYDLPPAKKWNEVTIITGFETIEELLSWLKSSTHPSPHLSSASKDYDKVPEWASQTQKR